MKIFNCVVPLLWAVAAASCVDYGDATSAVSVSVGVELPGGLAGGVLAGRAVLLAGSGGEVTAVTDAAGVATFPQVTPGVYDVSTSWGLSADEYREQSGDENVTNGCTVAGSQAQMLITSDSRLTMPTTIALRRDVVIGKVFYAGSRDNNRRSYQAGKYVELYNQSDSAVDVSGLCIGLCESESSPAYTLENIATALGDSVVLLKQVFRIPADAAFVVPAGGTVLIVNSATDHTASNSSEHDLSGADFEAKDTRGRTANNPATPALEVLHLTNEALSYMNLVQSGPCGVVIFRASKEEVDGWPTIYAYGRTRGTMFKTIPRRYVVDAVDCLRNTARGVDVSSKRIGANLDAGYVNIDAVSGYSGEVVYRKTSSVTVDGRAVLADTNNSSNDFQVSTTVAPREYDR